MYYLIPYKHNKMESDSSAQAEGLGCFPKQPSWKEPTPADDRRALENGTW